MTVEIRRQRRRAISARARCRSPCPPRPTPRSISSAASARPGPPARTARRTPAPPANPARSAPSRSIRAGHQALPGVETCTHLIVLYWMDQARRDLVVQVPTHYGDGTADLCAALAGAAQPDRAQPWSSFARSRATRLEVVGARLPRRHAAARHQALFRLDRLDPDARVRLARRAEGRQQQVKLLGRGASPAA